MSAQYHPHGMLLALYMNRANTGDVTFVVQSKRFQAHRCILATISRHYDAQFYGVVQTDPDDDIVVNGVTTEAFEAFIKYFYFGLIDLTTENIEDILRLATESQVMCLTRECSLFMMAQMKDPSNVLKFYRLAMAYDVEEVKNECKFHIATNAKEVFRSNEFVSNCDRSGLMEILKMDFLNCMESDVFDLCIVWAKSACKSKNIDDSSENMRTELGDVVKEIRFRSMSIEEFVQLHSQHSGLFTAQEVQEIVCIIGSLKGFKSISNFNMTLRSNSLSLHRLFSSTLVDRSAVLGATFGRADYTIVGTSQVPYKPTESGFDTVMKNGKEVRVGLRMHCISAMADYIDKDYDELRAEDYFTNRKKAESDSGAQMFDRSPVTFGCAGKPQTSSIDWLVSNGLVKNLLRCKDPIDDDSGFMESSSADPVTEDIQPNSIVSSAEMSTEPETNATEKRSNETAVTPSQKSIKRIKCRRNNANNSDADDSINEESFSPAYRILNQLLVVNQPPIRQSNEKTKEKENVENVNCDT